MVVAPLDQQPATPARLDANLPNEQYHAMTDHLSKSMLAVFADAPAKFKYHYLDGNPREETGAIRLGSAVHTYTLEKKEFESRFHVLPATYIDAKTGEEKPFRRDARMAIFKAEIEKAQGRALVSADEFETVKGMSAAMRSHKKVLALLDVPGKIEASIFWTDPATGLKMRCRPDFLRDDGLIVDYKSAASANPKDFQRAAFDHFYDVSVAMTAEGYEALTGKPASEYVFIVQEKKPPYVVEAYNTFAPFDESVSFRDVGKYRMRALLAKYMDCRRRNQWVGHSNKIETLGIPPWELKNLDMKAEGENAYAE